MARKATNILLQKAKKSKNDEFYTQLSDIEKELQYYKSHCFSLKKKKGVFLLNIAEIK